MKILTYLLLNGFAVFVAAYILPGIVVDGYLTAVIVAVVFGLLNTFLKPILTLLTLPLTVLTLGLFLLIINILIVFLTDKLVAGFQVQGWFYALLFSLVVTLITSFLSLLNGKK